MLRRGFRALALAVGMTVIVSAVFAAAGGAAPKPKGTDTVTCSLSAGTTFTWSTGTSEIVYDFYRSDGSLTDTGKFKTTGSGSNTIPTPPDATTVQGFWAKRNGPVGEHLPVTCSA